MSAVDEANRNGLSSNSPLLVGTQRRFIRLWRIPLVEDAACGAGQRGMNSNLLVFDFIGKYHEPM